MKALTRKVHAGEPVHEPAPKETPSPALLQLRAEVAAEQAQAEHERRVERLEAAGWKRDGNSWTREHRDDRWSVTGGRQVLTGADFEGATRAAYFVLQSEKAEANRQGLA